MIAMDHFVSLIPIPLNETLQMTPIHPYSELSSSSAVDSIPSNHYKTDNIYVIF